MGREILLFTAYFEHSVGFPLRYQRQFDARRVFSHERWKASFHSGSRFQLSRPTCGKTCPCTEAVFGFRNWEHQLSFRGDREGKGQKPDIIHHFLVSTLIRPLIHKCEIVKSVPWGPHYGVKLALSIKFETMVSRQLIGKFNKRDRHNTNVLQGLSTQHTDSADPAIWNEARRNCVFEARSLAARMVRKTRKLHVPNTLTRVVSWKRPMSWATLWRPGASLRTNVG